VAFRDADLGRRLYVSPYRATPSGSRKGRQVELSEEWRRLLDVVECSQDGDSVGPDERQAALDAVMHLGTSSVPDTVGCSVTLRGPGDLFVTPTSNGTIALELDQTQYDADDGPCLSAARHGRRERVDAMGLEERWPAVARHAVTLGVRSSLSVPLGLEVPAALNFYGREDSCYTSDRSAALAGMVARTTSALLGDTGTRPDGLSSGQLAEALACRTVINQAQGIVMAELGMDAGAAYRTLARRSAAQSRRLTEIAAEVVRSGSATGARKGLST
jgi:hypothetical protein